MVAVVDVDVVVVGGVVAYATLGLSNDLSLVVIYLEFV